MKKISCLIVALIIIFAFSACGKRADTDKQITFDSSTSIDPRNPGLYGTSLNSVTKNDNVITCDNGQASWKAAITNVYDAADYGLLLFVDGILTPFSTDFNDEEKELHTMSLETNEVREFLISVKAEHIPSDHTVYADVVTILNPNHTLRSTDYLNYLPHHALASFNFYKIENPNITEVKKYDISQIDYKVDLSDDLDRSYRSEITDENGNKSIINSLDNGNEFILSNDEDFSKLPSLFTAISGESLNLKIACLGRSEKFRLSLYINNTLVPAFDGNMYCDVETQRDKVMIKNISVSSEYLSELDEFNHMYLIAVPLEPNFDEAEYDRPIKTSTKMLYISSEDNIRKIEKKLTDEEESVTIFNEETKRSEKTTEPSTSISKTSSTHTKSYPNTLSDTTIEFSSTDTTINKAANQSLSTLNDNIWNLWVFEDNSIIIQLLSDRTLHTYNISSGKVSSNSVSGGHKVQKLENGIATLDYHDSSFTIYDNKLNKKQYGKLPYSVDEDELEFAVSQDGKYVVYCINEKGRGNVYMDTVSLDNKRKIVQLSASSVVGGVTWLDEITSARENKILFSGSYVDRVDSNGTSVLETCYGCITASGDINMQTSTGSNCLCYKGSYLTVADNSPLSGNSTDGVVEYWNVKNGKKSSFTFQNDNESRYAIVSEDGNYIASEDIEAENNKIIIKIYEISSKKVLFEKKYKYSALESYPIDFCENNQYAVLAIGGNVQKISLK